MFHINDDVFSALVQGGKKAETTCPGALQERLEQYPVICSWDSGEAIGPSSGQWEEQARLFDLYGDTLFLEVQQVYHGERYGNKAPEFYRVPRALYESLMETRRNEA